MVKPIAIDFIKEHRGEINNDAPLTHECVQYTVERVFSLPLADRLTPEEKERVRGAYAEAQSWLDEKPSIDSCNSHLRICAVAIQDRLERIFGTDFFKEEE